MYDTYHPPEESFISEKLSTELILVTFFYDELFGQCVFGSSPGKPKVDGRVTGIERKDVYKVGKKIGLIGFLRILRATRGGIIESIPWIKEVSTQAVTNESYQDWVLGVRRKYGDTVSIKLPVGIYDE